MKWSEGYFAFPRPSWGLWEALANTTIATLVRQFNALDGYNTAANEGFSQREQKHGETLKTTPRV